MATHPNYHNLLVTHPPSSLTRQAHDPCLIQTRDGQQYILDGEMTTNIPKGHCNLDRKVCPRTTQSTRTLSHGLFNISVADTVCTRHTQPGPHAVNVESAYGRCAYGQCPHACSRCQLPLQDCIRLLLNDTRGWSRNTSVEHGADESAWHGVPSPHATCTDHSYASYHYRNVSVSSLTIREDRVGTRVWSMELKSLHGMVCRVCMPHAHTTPAPATTTGLYPSSPVSVMPLVSPALAAPEGHQSGRSIPSVNGESTERSVRLPNRKMCGGRLCHGGAAANVPSSGDPLGAVCSSERKGCGLTHGQHERTRVGVTRVWRLELMSLCACGMCVRRMQSVSVACSRTDPHVPMPTLLGQLPLQNVHVACA